MSQVILSVVGSICLFIWTASCHSIFPACQNSAKCQNRLLQVSLIGIDHIQVDFTTLYSLLTCILLDNHDIRVLKFVTVEGFDDHLLTNATITKLRVQWRRQTRVEDVKKSVFKVTGRFLLKQPNTGIVGGRNFGIKTGVEHEECEIIKICLCKDDEDSVMKTFNCQMECTIWDVSQMQLDTVSHFGQDSPCFTHLTAFKLLNGGGKPLGGDNHSPAAIAAPFLVLITAVHLLGYLGGDTA